MSEFVFGVSASMVAAFLVWLIYAVLWPLFIDRMFYRGARVDGLWSILEVRDGKEVIVGKINLIQVGKRVTGTGERWVTRGGKESDRKFSYRGRFSGEQLTLVFQDTRGEDFDCGTYVFRMQNDGLELVGTSTFHGKKENRIVAEKRQLRKTLS